MGLKVRGSGLEFRGRGLGMARKRRVPLDTYHCLDSKDETRCRRCGDVGDSGMGYKVRVQDSRGVERRL